MPQKTLLFIFHAHVPYIRNEVPENSAEEFKFFDFLSYTFLPFLRMCSRLEADGIQFRCGLVLSPLLCEMLNDVLLQEQYIRFLDNHIDFGMKELARNRGTQAEPLIQKRMEAFQQDKTDFVTVYRKNLLKKINSFMVKGFIELLATAATPCFFPLYQNLSEALFAQTELGLINYREYFSAAPAGFWLPAMGYNTGLERIIKQYGLDYTVLASQSFLFAQKPPVNGIFSPAMTDNGLFCFGNDTIATSEILNSEQGLHTNPLYLDTERDAGFELDKQYLSSLFNVEKGRRFTGYAYIKRNGKDYYNEEAAKRQAEEDALVFLENRKQTLSEVEALAHTLPLCCVSVLPLQFFGSTWYEGFDWLEMVFRQAEAKGFTLSLPAEYLKQIHQVQHIEPFYASNLPSGYADELIDNSNDWMFPAIQKATERLIDIASRFPDDPGLKERILNMAAKEVLFAQSMDWPLLVNTEMSVEYAAQRCNEHLHAFTAVYESLGSGIVSTDWLIKREKKYPVFSEMNYRIFLKKQ
ncbi:MAG: 1,4-alpha-glucan branching protein domain-containing protein [Treponema sp.]